MKTENFLKAINIICGFHSTELIINKPKENGSIPTNTIHINNCVSGLITKLIEQGYSLSMNNGLLTLDDNLIHL